MPTRAPSQSRRGQKTHAREVVPSVSLPNANPAAPILTLIARPRHRPDNRTKGVAAMNIVPKKSDWQPPEKISREETIARSDAVLAKPDLPLKQTGDIF